MAKIVKLKRKTPKTEKRARPAATTRRASKPTKVTVKTEATPVKTETRASKPAATRTKTETKAAKPKPAKVKAETKPAVKVEDAARKAQSSRISQFGGRDLFSRLQITKALGGNPRAAPFVKSAAGTDKYLSGRFYVVENPAWAPFMPAAAGAAGALRARVARYWEDGEEGWAGATGKCGRELEMFCKRSETPALYEYVGRYALVPKDEIVEREDPATFSPQRRKAIYDGLLSLDVSPERANAFIDHPKSWELRPIKFVAYDEGLYAELQRAAR